MMRIAIVGAGISGISAAHVLVNAGHHVDLFENGGLIPYPHAPQYAAEVVYADRDLEVAPRLPADIKNLFQTGDYGGRLDDERVMGVGGTATRWFGITPRFRKESFRPATLHGFGADWPITYNDVEPFYCKAERYLGISGSGDDNPFAAPRSMPFPLPPFELSWQDLRFKEQLERAGLKVHTTPQARTRSAYDDRAGCENFGVCETCPIGARYSPNHHLERLLTSDRFALHSQCIVRRVVVEGGHARGLVYHRDHGAEETEHPADVVIVAAGGLETARLLLLSRGAGVHSEGLGNVSGLVGRNLGFHHVWWGKLVFANSVLPGRAGPPTMLSHQFSEAADSHGGILTELFDGYFGGYLQQLAGQSFENGADVLEALAPVRNMRPIGFHTETRPSERKIARLSDRKDRFGDPFLEVRYELDDFDHATFAAAQDLSGRFAKALGADVEPPGDVNGFWSAHHHLGTCRMGHDPSDSVVDGFGEVHGAKGVYLCGGSTFVTVTAFQPTLTMVALAMRTAAWIHSQSG